MKPAAKQGVQPPRVPKSLQAEVIESLADDGEYAAVSISGCNLAGQAAANVHFEQVHLRRTAFNQTQLPRLRMLDVRIEDSDFSGAVWEQAQLQRVEFIGCRLLGMQLFAARLQNILFQACTFEDAQLATAVCRAVRFEKCNLRNASFELADLAGGVFHQCDLTNADLRGTQLQGTDFRGSVLNAVQVEAKDLQGAVIDAAQALQIVGLLGVTVRASDESIYASPRWHLGTPHARRGKCQRSPAASPPPKQSPAPTTALTPKFYLLTLFTGTPIDALDQATVHL